MATEHAEHKHATIKTYIFVAVLLAVITAIEIAIPVLPEPHEPRWAFFGALYLLSIVKFGFVVAFFMHLRYDTRFYTIAFIAAMVIALGTFVALMALLHGKTPAMTAAETAAATQPTEAASGDTAQAGTAAETTAATASLAPGDAAAGAQLFSNLGCIACHTIETIPAARGTTGPKLDGLAERAGTRIEGKDADAYIRDSIENPAGFLVKGFLNVMPPLRGAMSNQDFEHIVAFLKTL